MGSEDLHLYPALERAIHSGGVLDCHREAAKGGYARVACLGDGETLLALGSGVTVYEALAAVEDDYLGGGPGAAEFRGEHCPTCVMKRLDPAGSSGAVSALDAHVLDGHRFEVGWAGGRFRLAAEWRREALVSREVMRQLIAAGAPTRWRHGDHVWEIIPGRSRKTGEWKFASYESVSRPPGSKEIFPAEKRRVEALGSSLTAVLRAAEELVAAARRDDEEWHRRTIRCT